MKITDRGLFFTEYKSASPGVFVSSFTDKDGAALLIDTVTLVRMYELCKFDLQHRGGWADVMARVETPNVRGKAETTAPLA
jgi:hypothetical protein